MQRRFIVGAVVIVLVAVTMLALLLTSSKMSRFEIGAVLPLSGDIASYGTKVKQGATIASDELKANGLPQVTVDFQDDQNNAKTAVGIMKTFCAVKRYPVVIGAAGSSVSMAIAPIAERNMVVQISPLSSSEELGNRGWKYFFRVCPADDQQARILADWVASKAYERVGVIYTNNSWGLGLANAFRRYYALHGRKQIALFEGTAEGQKDFRSVLTKAKSLGCQALVSPTYPKEGGILVLQSRELGFVSDWYGADNWGAPEFVQIAGSAADGCRFVAQYSYNGPEFRNLNSKYRKMTGKDADVFVAYGYDTVYAIAYALRNADSRRGPDICQALRSVSFQGASGQIGFDEHGNLKTDAFVKKQIVKGKTMDYKGES